MPGFDEKEPKSHLDGKSKKAKSAEDWMRVMRDDGGLLGTYTDKLLKIVEDAGESDWENTFEKVRDEGSNFAIKVAEDDIYPKSSAERAFPGLAAFERQFSVAKLDHSGHNFMMCVHTSPDMRRPILGAGRLLGGMFERSVPAVEKYNRQHHPSSSLDMASSDRVAFDNINTMVDIESLLARFAKAPEELPMLLSRLLQVCPNDEVQVRSQNIRVNPRGYTYLELFALAPFELFWADSVRIRQPERYMGAPIIRPENAERPVNPLFIYMLTRETPVRTEEMTDRESRHRGCPPPYSPFQKLHTKKHL